MESNGHVAGPAPLMDVEWSSEIGTLVGALAKAQMGFDPVLKDTDNPYYHSKYADLSSVIAATQKHLAANGLVVIQSPVNRDREAGVQTLLAHSSGQWHRASLFLPAVMSGRDGKERFDAQSVGSAITYARRYTYQSVIGVAAEVDDDANKAVGIGSKEAAQEVAKSKIDAHKASQAQQTPIDKPPVPPPAPAKATPQEAEDFVTLDGTLLGIEAKVTTKEKGSKPFYKVFMAVNERGEIMDKEAVAWENFALPEGTSLFEELGIMPSEAALSFVCKTSEYRGKTQYSIKSVNRIGSKVFGDSGQA